MIQLRIARAIEVGIFAAGLLLAQHGNGGGQVSGGGHSSAGSNVLSRPVGQGIPPSVLSQRGPNVGGSPYPIRSDIAPPTGLIPPAAAYTGISPNGLRVVGGHGGYEGGREGGHKYGKYPVTPFYSPIYPVYYGVSYDTGFYDSSVQPYAQGGYPPNQGMDPGAAQIAAAQDAMAEQIRQISSDLEQLKNTPAQPAGATQPPVPGAASSSQQPDQAPIQVVLNGGEKLTVKSYAVMGGMLWDFSGQRVRKVPISSINIAASTKATDDSGGEFPQLSAQ